MSLFQEGEFTGHSGGQLKWKIECDALEIDDWKCLGTMILDYEKRPFQAAIGIPRGGVMLGSFLNRTPHKPKDPYLICDDVLTTGGSMIEFRNKYFSKSESFGWVIFSRNSDPKNVGYLHYLQLCLMSLWIKLREWVWINLRSKTLNVVRRSVVKTSKSEGFRT